MTDPQTPLIYVDLVYRQRPDDFPDGTRWQPWSWRAKNAGNGEQLARSSETYTNRQDCIDAVEQLFGTRSTVHMREAEHANVELRAAV